MADDDTLNVSNEFAVNSGTNMPNHSMSMRGRGKYVQVGTGTPPVLRTRQEVYRFVAHLLHHADLIDLPDEPDAVELDDLIAAICD